MTALADAMKWIASPESLRWALCLILGLFCLANYWHPMVPIQERALFSALCVPALFLVTKPELDSRWWRYTDVGHAVLSVVAFGYIVLQWNEILLRQGAPTTGDMVLGGLAIYILIVGSTRNLGWGLTVVIGLFLAYTFLGQNLP